MIMIIIIATIIIITIIIMTTIGSMNHLKSDWVTAAAAGSQLPFVSNSAPLLLLLYPPLLQPLLFYSFILCSVNFYFILYCNLCCSAQ